MVVILPNGDIVSDNDARARSAAQANPASQPIARRQGTINHNDDQAQYVRQAPGASFLDSFNQRLAGLGVPTWHLGPYDVQPIASFAFLVSLLFFGFGGIFFALLLFLIVKYSQSGLGGGRTLQMPVLLQRMGFGGSENTGNVQSGPSVSGVRTQAQGQGQPSSSGGSHSWGSGNRLGSS